MNRREFLHRTTLAAGVALAGMRPRSVAAEPPPETTTLRLLQSPSLCGAPQYVAEALLQAEGFTDVRYIKVAGRSYDTAVQVDITLSFVGPQILAIDAALPIVQIAGGHVGCYELFGTNRVQTIRDLQGKTVAVRNLGSTEHVFLSSMVAYVGLDPRRDVNWVLHPPVKSASLLEEGTIDAFMAFPPQVQELRAKKAGHVIVNSALDRPWSQYFCCMVESNRDFVRTHPVATKRALRAILKATDICATEPDRAARTVLDRGFAARYDYTQQMMRELPYGRWREYDPEDTVRFYALRLREAGMIKSSPQKILADGTDWRFLNELKKELKA